MEIFLEIEASILLLIWRLPRGEGEEKGKERRTKTKPKQLLWLISQAFSRNNVDKKLRKFIASDILTYRQFFECWIFLQVQINPLDNPNISPSHKCKKNMFSGNKMRLCLVSIFNT